MLSSILMTCLCDRFIVITHTQIKKLPILYYLQILAAIDYFFGWHIVLKYKAVTKYLSILQNPWLFQHTCHLTDFLSTRHILFPYYKNYFNNYKVLLIKKLSIWHTNYLSTKHDCSYNSTNRKICGIVKLTGDIFK